MTQFDEAKPPLTPPGPDGSEMENTSHSHIPWEAMLCYLPVFCLYPWSLRKEMPELANHARQGMILFAVEMALFLITVPVFYKIVWIAILVVAALGVLAAYNGRPYKLPILWDLARKFGVVEASDSPDENPDTPDREV